MITLSEAVLDELKRLRGRTERTFRIEADHAEGYRIFSERSLSSFVKNGRLCAS